MKVRNLYRLKNKLGDYWVVAEHPTQAQEKLLTLLNKNSYGATDHRKVVNIELVAEGIENEEFITGKHFIE